MGFEERVIFCIFFKLGERHAGPGMGESFSCLSAGEQICLHFLLYVIFIDPNQKAAVCCSLSSSNDLILILAQCRKKEEG